MLFKAGEWGGRVVRMAVFGLKSLQVLVPRQLALVCHSVSMEWGVKLNHVVVIALYSCGKSYSQIFKLLMPLKILQMFIHQAIKHYKKLEGWRQGSVRTLEKCGAWSCYQNGTGAYSLKSTLETEDHVLKAELNDPIKSCLIRDNLHMRAHLRSKEHLLTPALKEIHGQVQGVSSSGTPRTGKKTSFSRMRNLSPSRSSIITRTTRFMLKRPLRCILRAQKGHRPSYIMVWCGVSHQGVTPLHFCKKGVKTGVRVYQQDMLQGAVKPLNMTLFSGQEWVFQQDSVPAQKVNSTQEWLQRNLLAFISAENWHSGSADLKTLDNKLWPVLEVMACWKCHNSPENLRRSLVKVAAEFPWRRSMQQEQSGQSISRLALGHRAAILCDIIINENLKLLQIHDLARKVDVLFNFPYIAHCTCNKTYGKTM